MASVLVPQGKPKTESSDKLVPSWARRFTDAQRDEMERDDYVLAASIFGILTTIFLVGLILTTLAVLFS